MINDPWHSSSWFFIVYGKERKCAESDKDCALFLDPGRKVFAVCSAEKAPFLLHSMALTGQRLDRCSLNQTFTEQDQTRGLRGFIVIVGDSNSHHTHDGPLSWYWLRNGASRKGARQGIHESTAYCSNTSSKDDFEDILENTGICEWKWVEEGY